MPVSTGLKWFTPIVAEDDRFVEPNFALGQFFYTSATARALVDRLDAFADPICMCTPRLAWEWQQRGRVVRLLDCDRRFSTIAGYRYFDLLRPSRVEGAFDAIVFDPVFMDAALLRRAIDVLVGSNVAPEAVALYVTFPLEREAELLSRFAGWALRRLDFRLCYNNVKPDGFDSFRLYGSRELPLPAEG